MRRARTRLAMVVVAAGALGAGAVAVAGSGSSVREQLSGYEEVPALSTPGLGTFHASISRSAGEIRYRLRYEDLETPVTQAHIHFENRSNAGPIVVFLCTNLGNGPAGTQACPPDGGRVTGTIRAADVGAGAFDEFVAALRSGATYVNVHSEGRPTGEIRAQIEPRGLPGQHKHDSDDH